MKIMNPTAHTGEELAVFIDRGGGMRGLVEANASGFFAEFVARFASPGIMEAARAMTSPSYPASTNTLAVTVVPSLSVRLRMRTPSFSTFSTRKP